MGVFNTLRVKMGTVLIVLIGGSTLAFLAGDLLRKNSVLLGKNKNDVGVIAGQDIAMQQYQNQIEQMKYNYTASTGNTPSEAEMNTIRQQAWEYLIVKIAFQKQYDELGVEVTQQELVDMVQGNNINPIVKQNFTDPKTGKFDKDRVVQILAQLANMPAKQQAQWYQFEQSLIPARLRTKYEALLDKTSFVTKAEGEQQYQEQTAVAEAKYLYVPFYSIPDSAVSVTDQELNTYLDKHEDEYNTDATRKIKFIRFPIRPSHADTVFLRKDIEDLKKEFQNVTDDSTFAAANSDIASSNVYNVYHMGEMPDILQSNVNILKQGDVLGPYINNGGYELYKVTRVFDDTVSSVKASHILIKPEDDTPEAKAKAKAKAESVLRKAEAGEDFAELAKDNSDGPTASRGGDLGWFREGRMVAPFEKAVFAKKGTGLINHVVETDYGYHVIKVTGEKTNKAYAISTVHREIIASDDTRDSIFRKADYFAATNQNETDFINGAKKDGYNVLNSGILSKNQQRIGVLGDAREIVRWSFNDAEMGKVSKVFELPDDYVIAVLTDKTEDGEVNLADVRTKVERAVKNEKKAKMITEKLNGLKDKGDLDAIAKAYGPDANVYFDSNLKLESNSLPSVGNAPAAVGTVFGLKEGETSAPVKATNGMVMITLQSKTPAPQIADYQQYRDKLQQQRNNAVSYDVKQAIEKHSDIKDERYKFF